MQFSHRILSVAVPPVDAINARRLELEKRGRRIINLGQAIPFFGPPADAVNAVTQSMTSISTHQYTQDAGLPELRAAIASHAGRQNKSIDPEHVIVTAGANHAFALVCYALLDEGTSVGLLSPYFLNHHMALQAIGANSIEIQPDHVFCYNYEVIEQCIVENRMRMLVVVNPSNPTGKIFQCNELLAIADICLRNNAWLIVDEVYRAFVPAEGHSLAHELTNKAPNIISIWSFSKEYGMTGWRIGAIHAPDELIHQLIKAQDFSLICSPHPAQIMALHCLKQYPHYASSFRETLESRRRKAVKCLTSRSNMQVYPSEGGYFIWFRPDTGNADPLLAYKILEATGVCLLPGISFGKMWSSWLRLSFGNIDELELIRGIDLIMDFTDDLKTK